MIQNIKTFIKQILLSGLSGLLICGQITYGFAQTATPIPQPLTQFLDANANPLSSGTVTTFIPNTSTKVTTYQDINQTTPNANPLTLDAAGRAKIFGNGSFRMQVKDNLGNLIYDYVTNAPNPGGSIIVTGDGDLVGTIKPWAGLAPPNQYVFAAGQALSRTNFSALLTAITQSVTVNCTVGNPTLTGISDTSQIPNGAAVEGSCVPPASTVQSKTSSSVTLNNNATSTTSTTAIFYPYGNGDASTTFNVPDLRGNTIAGRPNMGGVASSNLTQQFFVANPQAIGAVGGSQSGQLSVGNIPSIAPGLNLTDPGHAHTFPGNQITLQNGSGTAALNISSGTNSTSISTTGITISSNHIGGSGAALSATLVLGGSGYTNGSQVLTISGGTCTVQPAFNVTVAGNVVTSVNSVQTAGNCPVPTIMPASVTGGGGTGAKLDVSFTAQSFATIQPTITLNYIIKVTPDASATQASGVSSLGGMIGAIACGIGLSCTGNTITNTFAGRTRLNGDISIYVNTGGNNNNDCLSPATACATGSHAWDLAANNYDCNGHVITIQFANQTHTTGIATTKGIVGCYGMDSVIVDGGGGTINSAGVAMAFGLTNIFGSGPQLTLKNITLIGTVDLALYSGGTQVLLDPACTVNFGPASNSGQGQIVIGHQAFLYGKCYTISGGASQHMFNYSNSFTAIEQSGVITCVNSPAFTQFLNMSQSATVSFGTSSFSAGCSTVTGHQFRASLGSTLTSGGVTLPGDTSPLIFGSAKWYSLPAPTITCDGNPVHPTITGTDLGGIFEVGTVAPSTNCTMTFASPTVAGCAVNTNSATAQPGLIFGTMNGAQFSFSYPSVSNTFFTYTCQYQNG